MIHRLWPEAVRVLRVEVGLELRRSTGSEAQLGQARTQCAEGRYPRLMRAMRAASSTWPATTRGARRPFRHRFGEARSKSLLLPSGVEL